MSKKFNIQNYSNLFKGAHPLNFKNAKLMRGHESTNPEKILWELLRNRQLKNLKFRRQHPIGNYIADFYCHEEKLIIEIDGGYHSEELQKEFDQLRTEILNKHGIRVIRFSNEEILQDPQKILIILKDILSIPLSGLERGQG